MRSVLLKEYSKVDGQTGKHSHSIVSKNVTIDGTRQSVLLNENESPLSRLYYRKTKAGKSYISSHEFEAGERIRRDFERGLLQPKVTADLSSIPGLKGQKAHADPGDLADFALDARNKVYRATETLGPELSGAVIDICCFLKGLETVERERKWPPRSAKLMLKTGLSILARHYGIKGYTNAKNTKRTVWNGQGYRPEFQA